jgi:hypothetical protein
MRYLFFKVQVELVDDSDRRKASSTILLTLAISWNVNLGEEGGSQLYCES